MAISNQQLSEDSMNTEELIDAEEDSQLADLVRSREGQNEIDVDLDDL